MATLVLRELHVTALLVALLGITLAESLTVPFRPYRVEVSGVALMPVGAKYRFWIPSNLAYGPNGAPGGKIGPDATLTFDVELMGVLQ